jgi:hypothetical protein
MLHVRDCPGTTALFDVCPFPWCRKVKHLLHHLVTCQEQEYCSICTPTDLSPSLTVLQGLNEHRFKGLRDQLAAHAKISAEARVKACYTKPAGSQNQAVAQNSMPIQSPLNELSPLEGGCTIVDLKEDRDLQVAEAPSIVSDKKSLSHDTLRADSSAATASTPSPALASLSPVKDCEVERDENYSQLGEVLQTGTADPVIPVVVVPQCKTEPNETPSHVDDDDDVGSSEKKAIGPSQLQPDL